jgi:hypothetical protein
MQMKKIFTLLFIAAITSVFAQYPTDSLIAYFPFNSNILNTTFYGIPSWSTGVTGQTYGNDRNANSNGAIQSPSEFSGDGRISLDDFPKYKMTGPFTISLWVRPQASYNGGAPTPIQIGNSITIQFQTFIGSTDLIRPRGVLKTSNNQFEVIGNAPTFNISTQPWIHLALVRTNSGQLILYVNLTGANVTTFGNNSYATSGSVLDPAFGIGEDLTIGFAPDPNNPTTREFGGFIDDVFIYNRALDANELFNIYGLNNSTSVPCSPPAPTFTGSPASLEVCQGIQLGLTADLTIPGASYFWYNQITDVNPAGGGAFFLPNTSTPGTRQVYLRQSVTYCTQQSSSTVIEYEVNPAPTISVVDEDNNAVTALTVDLCVGDSLLYTASGTADSYNYFFSTEQQGMLTQEKFNIVGTINSTGCTASFQQNVNRVSIATNLLSSTQLTAGETSGQQYDWFDCDADTLVATTTTNSYIPTFNGSFYVKITKNGCDAETVCANFFSCDNVALDLDGDVTDNNVLITATGGTEPYTYSWTGPAGFTAGDVTELNDLANGTYTATVEDASGCTATFTALVDVGTNIRNVNNDLVKIYPNPANSVVKVEGDLTGAALRMLDISGKEVMVVNDASIISEINVSNLNNGIYFIEVASTTSRSVHKLIISK